MIGPYIVGVITNGPSGNTVTQWRIVFYITAAVSVSCAIFFFFFASGELGDWETVNPNETEDALQLPELKGGLNIDQKAETPLAAGGKQALLRFRAKSLPLQPLQPLQPLHDSQTQTSIA
jgi:hypothetical protein